MTFPVMYRTDTPARSAPRLSAGQEVTPDANRYRHRDPAAASRPPDPREPIRHQALTCMPLLAEGLDDPDWLTLDEAGDIVAITEVNEDGLVPERAPRPGHRRARPGGRSQRRAPPENGLTGEALTTEDRIAHLMAFPLPPDVDGGPAPQNRRTPLARGGQLTRQWRLLQLIDRPQGHHGRRCRA